MKIIAKISDEIECLLRQADEYIDCANYRKEENPNLAEVYYTLSLERMRDQDMLHAQVVNIINEYKKDNEVPEGMKALYDYLHKKFIDWAGKIKVKQNMYKTNI